MTGIIGGNGEPSPFGFHRGTHLILSHPELEGSPISVIGLRGLAET